MAPTLIQPPNNNPNSRPRRVCFSLAAYAKVVVQHLRACNVSVDDGLADDEFAAIESSLNFTFPPELRSILREGLPFGPGFPNWRSSSIQQLQILINLPMLGLCKDVATNNFWAESWGEKPRNLDESVNLAKGFLQKAPSLVPIYRHWYIPSAPNLAGNPVFYVQGGDVRLSSFDVAGFFKLVDFGLKEGVKSTESLTGLLNSPVWAATEARRIEFWTELAEREAVLCHRSWTGSVDGFLRDMCGRLRDGGWREEEVREMTMMEGADDDGGRRPGVEAVIRSREGVAWHVRAWSLKLLRAGWSREDVADSLGCLVQNGLSDGESCSWLDFQRTKSHLLQAT